MIPATILSGSPTEIGWSMGTAFGSLINKFVDARLALLKTELPLSRVASDVAWLSRLGNTLLDSAALHCPAGAEELSATAASAGTDLGLTVIAAAYTDTYDLVASESGMHARSEQGECSSFQCPDVAFGAPPVAGQTWDMPPGTLQYAVVVDRYRDDAPPLRVITLVTGLAYMGFRLDGEVCLGTTNVSSPAVSTAGVVFPVVVVEALESASASDAVNRVLTIPAVSGHFYYAIDSVHVEGAEVDGERGVRLTPARPTAHTNHFHSPEMTRAEPGPSSAAREVSLGKLLPEIGAASDPSASFRRAVTDHSNGLCRHDELDPCGFRSTTGAAMVFDPARERVSMTLGLPCASQWETTYLRKDACK